MSDDSRFCKPCAVAFGVGFEEGIESGSKN